MHLHALLLMMVLGILNQLVVVVGGGAPTAGRRTGLSPLPRGSQREPARSCAAAAARGQGVPRRAGAGRRR